MALVITKTVETIKRDYWGVTLEIAQGNNRSFRDKISKLKKGLPSSGNRHRKKPDDLLDLSAVDQDKLLSQAYAGTVLVGWDNFIVDGKTIPFSVESAAELLFNDSNCREFVAEEANDFFDFIEEEKAELVKK